METQPIFKVTDANGKEELITLSKIDANGAPTIPPKEIKARAEAIVAGTPLAEGKEPKVRVLLADQFSALLKDQGHPSPEGWKETPVSALHPDHATTDEAVQRFLVNRQLRMVMGNLDVDTINLRYMLNDESDCSTKVWHGVMERSIAPFFVKHNLPVE